MKDLIEAFTIFGKYVDYYNPTYCSHDEMNINVDPSVVSADDLKRLDELSFIPNRFEGFVSYRFGSC